MGGPVGAFDAQIALAERYGWTPQEVAAMDADFLAEALTRLRAEADVEAAKERKKKRELSRSGSGRVTDDVDMSEIPDGKQSRARAGPQSGR